MLSDELFEPSDMDTKNLQERVTEAANKSKFVAEAMLIDVMAENRIIPTDIVMRMRTCSDGMAGDTVYLYRNHIIARVLA